MASQAAVIEAQPTSSRNSFQKRIDQLTRKAVDAERRAPQDAERKVDGLQVEVSN